MFPLALVATLLLAPAARADCPASRTARTVLLAGGYTAAQATAIALRHQDWWTPPARGFHVNWGRSASAGQDALLHASLSYQASQAGRLLWRWACAPEPLAAWLGALTGLALQLPKEIGDGFHQNGFSGTDMAWSAAGALLPALHHAVPVTRTAAVKVWYWPSAEYRRRTGPLPQLENDYAGQRYFVSLNPARGGAPVWPAWLGVAVGHGVPHWVTRPPRHEWYITLDLDFRGLPIRTPWWRTVATLLDQIHFPLPGLRVSHGELAVGFF